MIYDFHTHTFLSDGVLSPVELARRALVKGYRAIGITDHVGLGGQKRLLRELTEDCALASEQWGLVAIPGVELTHIPVRAIPRVAQQAKEAGARLVVVHGETIVEPVEQGTNLAAASCPYVDILAHPGLLTLEEARAAARNGVFIELSARRGHSLTNGHVARVAIEAGASLLLDSDAHSPEDLLTTEIATQIALGAGISADEAQRALKGNPQLLLKKLGVRLDPSTP